MSFNQSYQELIDDAKKAFKYEEKTEYEKRKFRNSLKETFPKLKSIGFISGTKQVLVYQ